MSAAGLTVLGQELEVVKELIISFGMEDIFQ
jgi:hypothetical protein